ncbi:MAG: outer membrane protein assembly factor BamD, partial [Planctomycetota bacterium]
KRWLKDNERSRNPYFPEALLLIGDAKVAQRDEFEALYDYERLILEYPESPEFVSAIERELEIATQYVNGLRRKAFGFRFEDASNIGEELLIRVQERLPGSRLAERAGIELADHYYREREMQLASDAYELFLANYPKSQHRRKALERRVYANIARFKGPEYDASGLRNAKALVQDYEAEFPIDAERTGLNSALIARLDESAATQMLDSADWYLRVNDDVAARYTLRRLIRQYPRTIAASAAFQIMESNGWAPPASAPPSGPDPDPDPGSVPDADTPTPADEDARE